MTDERIAEFQKELDAIQGPTVDELLNRLTNHLDYMAERLDSVYEMTVALLAREQADVE